MSEFKTIISKHQVLGVLMVNSEWIQHDVTETMWTPQGALKLVLSCMWTPFVPRDHLNLV